MIYDRACLTAIHPNQRKEFIKIYDKLLVKNGKILLIVPSYSNSDQIDGPPWSIDQSIIYKLFQKEKFNIEFKEQKLEDKNLPGNVKKYSKNVKFYNNVYIITKK